MIIPPYFGFEDIYGRDLFSRQDFTLLSERLAGIDAQFLLSINDVPEIRSTFSGFNIREVQTTYASRKPGNTAARELLISNY